MKTGELFKKAGEVVGRKKQFSSEEIEKLKALGYVAD